MPSIAQQDYLIIKPNENRVFTQDAAALSALLRAIEKGVVFDCLCGNLTEKAADELKGCQNYSRALSLYYAPTSPINTFVYFHDPNNKEILEVGLPYTVAQYQGLAAVQQAEDVFFQSPVNLMPNIGTRTEANILCEAEEGVDICIDGKYLLAGKVSGRLASLTIAETGPGEGEAFVNITWEDAQKLIGLPIS